MEALAAFGIACNVMQVIDFTREVIVTCKEIYNSGTYFDQKGSIDKDLTHLQSLRDDLQTKVNNGGVIDPSEEELLEIAKDCLVASAKLKEMVAKLESPSAKGSMFRSLYSGVSAKMKEGRLQKLEDMVNKQQARLSSRLLVKICKSSDALAIQQDARFATLDETLRTFIGNIAQGQKSLELLVKEQTVSINVHTTTEVTAQASSIKEHIATEAQLLREAIVFEIHKNKTAVDEIVPGISRETCKRLLRSLESDGLQIRWHQVVKSHTSTFEWIYGKRQMFSANRQARIDKCLYGAAGRSARKDTAPQVSTQTANSTTAIVNGGDTRDSIISPEHTCRPDIEASFSCFPCWLDESPRTPYWISGKAGSGKSTLVKFIVGHPTTRRLLERKHGPTLILSHFLWLSGSLVQRSLQGVLLSLLNQILGQTQIQQDPLEKTHVMEERKWTAKAVDTILHLVPNALYKTSIQDWSCQELLDSLVALLEETPETVCIFLDGLDEADFEHESADPKPVLTLVNTLCRVSGVKVCVSSRPEPAFEAAFHKRPQLKLQDLTRDDIITYVMDTFESQSPHEYEGHGSSKSMVKDLADKICRYSDGVFVWVVFVMRSLLRGLLNGDTLIQMHQRLELLPRNINRLYQDMLGRLGEDREIYQQEAALYINMVLDGRDLIRKLGTHPYKAFASPSTFTDVQLYNAIQPCEILSLFSDPYKWRKPNSCSTEFGKRLETVTAGLLQIVPRWIPNEGRRITFVHRSAREFFTNTAEGKQVLAADKSGSKWRQTCLLKGILAMIWITSVEQYKFDVISAIPKGTVREFLDLIGTGYGSDYLDREQLVSLLRLSEQAFYAHARHTGHYYQPIYWRPIWGFSEPIPEAFDFTMFNVDYGGKSVLQPLLGVDYESAEHHLLPRGLQQPNGQLPLPLVYSPGYIAHVLLDLLSKVHYGLNSDRASWALDQWTFDNRPQGNATTGPILGFAGACITSIIRTQCLRWGHDENTLYSRLRRCLSLKGAWDERPIFALQGYVPYGGGRIFSEWPLLAWSSTKKETTKTFLLLAQASMPYLVLASLIYARKVNAGVVDCFDDLRAEASRRYDKGPLNADIFMLIWFDDPGDGSGKGEHGFVDVSDQPWSSLALDQFSFGLETLRPLLDYETLEAASKDQEKAYSSLEEVNDVILRRISQ